MSGIPQLNPIGPGQLPVPSSYPNQLPISRYFDMGSSQYGVGNVMSGLSGLASMVPVVGPLLGAGMNIIGTAMQNSQQEAFFNNYMSPQARMAQMRAAGINPNAAAQGISGSSAPQMNAAAPTSAFSSLGEQLGNSVNNALTAENLAANTKKVETEAEGQDLMNKVTEVELGMKPDMLTAELEEKKAHAEEMRQNVTNLKKELDRIDQEIKNLKAQETLIIAQEGQVAYENRLKEAQTKREQADEALAKANKELAEVNKEIQEKERDNYLTPAERIEKTATANAAAPVDETPQGRIAKEYEKEMNEALAEIDQRIKQKAAIFGPNHSEVRKLRNERDRIIRRYRNRIRRINKGSTVGGSVAGFGLNAGG